MAEPKRVDAVLYSAIAVLVIAVLAVGGWFGYTVYRDRQLATQATPALRLISQLKDAVKKTPNDAVLRVRLGEAMAGAGKPQDAIEQFNAALKIDPKHTGAYLDLGILAMTQNRPAEAEKYFKKVLELTAGSEYEQVNQRREVALFSLGKLAMERKDYEEAVGQFKAALRIRKDASDTYFYLANALDALGQTEDARKQLETALAFDPNFAQANYFMAELYLREGDKINASYHAAKAAKVEPDAKEPKQLLAKIGTAEEWTKTAQDKLAAGDVEAALQAALIATNLDPESFDAQKVHAEVLVQRGDKKDALQVYKKAAALEPDDASVKAAIAKLEKSSKS